MLERRPLGLGKKFSSNEEKPKDFSNLLKKERKGGKKTPKCGVI